MTARNRLKLVYTEKLNNKIMEQRGIVAHLMASDPRYRQYPMVSLKIWIDPAIFTGQLQIFYDYHSGYPVGYITWAFLAPDVEHRWLNEPTVVLHESEWNEGHALWIMDFFAAPGYCEDIVEYVGQHMFPDHHTAHSLRRDQQGRVRKVSCWKRRANRATFA